MKTQGITAVALQPNCTAAATIVQTLIYLVLKPVLKTHKTNDVPSLFHLSNFRRLNKATELKFALFLKEQEKTTTSRLLILLFRGFVFIH